MLRCLITFCNAQMLYVSLFQNSYILSVSLIAMICRNVLWASWPLSHGSWNYNYLCNQYLSLLMLWVRISIRTRCTTLCDKVCQWLATGLWFSPGPPVSSTNKADRHDITGIKHHQTKKNKKTKCSMFNRYSCPNAPCVVSNYKCVMLSRYKMPKMYHG
jgi:hypothetical protein